MRRTCILVVVGLMAACGKTDSESTPTAPYSLQRLGDTTTAHSTRPIRPDTVRPELVQAYGTVGSGAVTDLGWIEAFAPTANGVVVFDPYQGLIEVSASNEGRVIAGLGAGPREVRRVSAVASDMKGRIAAIDAGNSRLVLLGHGNVTTRPWQTFRPRYGSDAVAFDANGNLWIALGRPRGTAGSAIDRPAYYQLDEQLKIVDSVSVPAEHGGCEAWPSAEYAEGFWDDLRERWRPRLKWARGPDGTLAIGCPSEYQVELGGGTDVVELSRDWTPVPVGVDERGWIRERGYFPPGEPIPESKPAYAALAVSPEGRVWVWPESESFFGPLELRTPTGGTLQRTTMRLKDSGAFDVFDVRGVWLGRVELPPGAAYTGHPPNPPPVIRGDTMWVVYRNAQDVNFVGRFEWSW